jgi:glycosyltransferase involved in cell wall biosynthesis
MAVLLIGNFLSHTNGTYSVCEDLAAHLRDAGWDVLTVSRIPYRLPRILDMLTTIYRKRHKYDVAQVDVYSGRAFLWAEAVSWMLRLLHKPYILTLHGGNLPSFSLKRQARVRHLLTSAAAVTSPSRYLYEQMAAYRPDFLIQPNPLNIDSYKFRLREKPNPYLIWLRAFHGMYNPTMAASVLALLTKEFPDVYLTMLGPDKEDGSFNAAREVASELGVHDRIMLPGSVTKAAVSHWLNTGDIFLNTTNVDNTPISVLEAMACGLCVVSTNVGGVPYLLKHEHNALLVPPNNPEAMANAVRRILNEPGLAARLSHNARLEAQNFDWSAILPQWEKLFTAVSQGRTA